MSTRRVSSCAPIGSREPSSLGLQSRLYKMAAIRCSACSGGAFGSCLAGPGASCAGRSTDDDEARIRADQRRLSVHSRLERETHRTTVTAGLLTEDPAISERLGGQDVAVEQPRDIRLSFNAVPEIYDEVRPSYPSAMFDALFEVLPPEPSILEVGPGTGQATKDLLARGASVRAIEIGPEMAAKLRSNLPSDRLRVTVADFEEMDVAPGSADAIFSANAYHWISRRAQTDRPASILRSGGVVAVVDLVQVDSADDAGFFIACQPLYERYGQGHTGPPAPTRDEVDPEIRRALEADARFHSVAVLRYDWNQTYTASEYRRLMLSYSGTQMMNEVDRVGLLDDMEAFIREAFGGRITRPLVVTLTTAVRT